MISNISMHDFLLSKIEKNIIDIRSIEKFNSNHIEGAINIDSNKLILEPYKYLNRNQRYYIYCQKGITSNKICQILNKMGYRTTNILGGYEEWILRK